MKLPLHPLAWFVSILVWGTLPVAAAPAPAPTGTTPVATAAAPAKATEHFDRTKERIDELLKRRINPDPLPAALPNPFQVTEEAVATSAVHAPPGPEQTAAPAKVDPPADYLQPGSDEEILARFIPTLRISGTGQLNGRSYLIINQTPYKEGDHITVSKTPLIVFQIVHIASGELTLGYNETVQILKFKN